eukprot:CAMPEP_0194328216 /NCGR_PEP_ID=MMETSP0171-20130528/43864_1 /TAXON_ID=218684 /ORGANISM="Corethron pennatum, Strain L29A3" /LENGTH=811 /DNA_ID=CAMNT_0039088459 /DNA_START=18 /DNA_END=2449 /DNA_ORIENTATION=-
MVELLGRDEKELGHDEDKDGEGSGGTDQEQGPGQGKSASMQRAIGAMTGLTAAMAEVVGTDKGGDRAGVFFEKGKIAKAGDKLVQLITLLAVALDQHGDIVASSSLSKILLDYVILRAKSIGRNVNRGINRTAYPAPRRLATPAGRGLDPNLPPSPNRRGGRMGPVASAAARRKKKPAVAMRGALADSLTPPLDPHNPMVQVGDVLKRAQSYLADRDSPPARLLHDELVDLLCTLLDVDTDADLMDGDVNANDLGHAGNLLKLLVLNEVGNADADADAEGNSGNRFLRVVHRLAGSKSVAGRVTACCLGPIFWSHLDFAHQLQLRGVITRSLHDAESSVRKATAHVLHQIAELVFDPRCVPWLVLMCQRAMTDPDPKLRAASMTLTWHLAEHLPNAFIGNAREGCRSLRRLPSRDDPTFTEVYLLQCKLLPVATRLAEDKSYSVRLSVAAQCDRLCTSLGEHWTAVIIDLFQALLQDSDDRVRAEATYCMPRVIQCAHISTSDGVLETILRVSMKLQTDTSKAVRLALATACGDLLRFLVRNDASELTLSQNKRHIDVVLIPLLQRLLNDADPEVTSAALRAVANASPQKVMLERKMSCTLERQKSNISVESSDGKDPVIDPVLSESQILRLLPTLGDLANSTKWRVRKSAVEIVPALLRCTASLETRSQIARLCIKLMADPVDEVRATSADCLCLGGDCLDHDGGEEWMEAIVIPHLKACQESREFKQRQLCLRMVGSIIQSRAWESARPSALHEILQIAALLGMDPIVNVRLKLARLLDEVLKELLEDANQEVEFVKYILEDLNAYEVS